MSYSRSILSKSKLLSMQSGMYKGIDVTKQYSFEYLRCAAYGANGSIAGHIFFVSIFENWAHMAQLPLGWKTNFIYNGLIHKGEWFRDTIGGIFQHDFPYSIGSSRFPDVDFLEQFKYIRLVNPEPVEDISAEVSILCCVCSVERASEEVNKHFSTVQF